MNYKSKSDDSCKTRLRFYFFHKALKGSTELSIQEFEKFDVDEKQNLIHLYTTAYQHGDRESKITCDLNTTTPDDVYSRMAILEKDNKAFIEQAKTVYFKNIFPGKLSPEYFIELEKETHCFYCGSKHSDLLDLMEGGCIFKKNERGWNLELDRKAPNMEYSKDNCVMACYWCNNAKTDEFSAEEFKPIGEAIGQVFKDRLKKLQK